MSRRAPGGGARGAISGTPRGSRGAEPAPAGGAPGAPRAIRVSDGAVFSEGRRVGTMKPEPAPAYEAPTLTTLGPAEVVLGSHRHRHELKSWPETFRAVVSGRKRFEIRRDDRQPRFATGDLVLLREYVPDLQAYTERTATYLIGHVERSACLPSGWCGFELLDADDAVRFATAILGPPRGTR